MELGWILMHLWRTSLGPASSLTGVDWAPYRYGWSPKGGRGLENRRLTVVEGIQERNRLSSYQLFRG